MKISVIGCGYLGAVHAASLAKLGHDVIGIDIDKGRIDNLRAGIAPFFEPGLTELLADGCRSGRLKFSAEIADVRGAQVHFLCVATPQRKGENAADLDYLDHAIETLVPHLAPGDLVAGKSTVPVGSARKFAAQIARAEPNAMLAWNPEFLREGFAIEDTMTPDRLVYGLPDDSTAAAAMEALDEVYQRPLETGTPRITTDYETAELVKTAANAFLATKISFINAMAEVCEVSGADVTLLADAIGYDKRIGRKFLNAGLGFGGGCLPKDIRAFMARAGELGADQALTFLREVDSINMRRRARTIDLAREMCGGSLLGQHIAVLGLAFKPNSDDVRDSPALSVAAQLELQGASVTATDPKALETSRRRFPELRLVDSVEEATRNADLTMLLTEWPQYRDLDPEWLGTAVRKRIIVDGRNCLDPLKWRAAGWRYRALGRP